MPHTDGDFGGYVIDRMLGRGGNATVYLARRPGAPEAVALKVLHATHRNEDDLVQLRWEFELAHRIIDRHSVRVYQLGPFWLTMQYIDGGNITALTAEQRLAALTQIAATLDHIHHLGIVHCDVKPANILVHRDFGAGGAVLVDYGVAHSLAQDMAIRLRRDHAQRLTLDPARRINRMPTERPPVHASLPYAAPELLTGRMPSAATDEYALACTAIELISGRTPFIADTADELVDAHLFGVRHFDWLPSALAPITARAVARDPAARYQSCTELIDTVRKGLAGG